MTNYSKWDKFDPDLVCVEIEKQQAVESSKVAKKKVFQAIASESEQSILEAKRNAEALQSQVRLSLFKIYMILVSAYNYKLCRLMWLH